MTKKDTAPAPENAPEMSPAEKAKLEAEYKIEQEKLGSMQDATSNEAHTVAQESLAVMMALGWTWDSALIVIKDEEGKPVKQEAKLVIRPLKLAEWQQVQKEKLRTELSGGKSGIIV